MSQDYAGMRTSDRTNRQVNSHAFMAHAEKMRLFNLTSSFDIFDGDLSAANSPATKASMSSAKAEEGANKPEKATAPTFHITSRRSRFPSLLIFSLRVQLTSSACGCFLPLALLITMVGAETGFGTNVLKAQVCEILIAMSNDRIDRKEFIATAGYFSRETAAPWIKVDNVCCSISHPAPALQIWMTIR